MESDIGDNTLNGNQESWVMCLRLEHLDVIWENNELLATFTSGTSSCGGATSDTGDKQTNVSSIGGNGYSLKDLLLDLLPALVIKIAEVSGGKILLLFGALLLLPLPGANTTIFLLAFLEMTGLPALGYLTT